MHTSALCTYMHTQALCIYMHTLVRTHLYVCIHTVYTLCYTLWYVARGHGPHISLSAHGDVPSCGKPRREICALTVTMRVWIGCVGVYAHSA